MRVLPFQQNTGGFFIVVLEKTSEYVIENKKRNITTTSAINSIATGESVVAGTTDLKRKVSPEVTSLVASDLSSNTTTEVTQSPPPPQPVASNETDSLSKKLKLESDEGVVQDEIETATAAGFSENPAKPEQHQATESSDKVDDIVGQGVRISKHRKAQLANKDISYFFLEENSPEVQSVS